MFNNLKLGQKIGLGFAILMVFLSMVMLINIFALSNANTGIESYSRQSNTLEFSYHIRNKLFEVKEKAQAYLLSNSDVDIQDYNQHISDLEQALQSHLSSFDSNNAQVLEHISKQLSRYDAIFSEVVQLTIKRSKILLESLEPNGEKMLSTMNLLAKKAYDAGDVKSAYYASHVQEKLLSTRLYVMKFLHSSSEENYGIALENMQELQREVMELEALLTDSSLHTLLMQYHGSHKAYLDAMGMIQQVEIVRKELIEVQLKGAEAEIEKDAMRIQSSANDNKKATELELKSATDQSIQFSIIIAIAAVVTSGVLAYKITTSITKPVLEAIEAAQKLSHGDLSVTFDQFDNTRKDEIGTLLGAISLTALKLREMVGTITQAGKELNLASSEMIRLTEKSSYSIQTQEQETESVATAMAEMTATVKDVAQNTLNAEQAAEEARQKASEGNSLAKETVCTINLLAESVINSADKLAVVESDSDDIGDILNVIREVADQTNLLALNAAIEAARAGEQGRSFAVVADEVRNLAQRTQESIAQIHTIIEKLQNGIQETVLAMNSGKEQTLSSVDQIGTTGQALGAIEDSVLVISDMNSQIASASGQQSSVAESISENIESVREIARVNTATIVEINSLSTDIDRLSENLSKLINQFKV